MTTILRILSTTINSSSSIDVAFTDALTTNLVPANVSIISQTSNVPNANVLKVSVNKNILSIVCQPLTPYADYYLQFQSVVNSPFISINGQSKISEDGISNKVVITGPIQSDNPVMDFLQSFYRNNIYRADDNTTIINSYLQSVAIDFAKALYDIRQVKNENYLSFTIIDELHNRGEGAFDRLYEEAAYDVFRVGFAPTNALVSTSFIFSEVPSYPITLQKQTATEIIKASSTDTIGFFDINTLTFTLTNYPVTKVNSIVFTLTTTHPVYNYNIESLGYQLLDSRYDQDFASSYLLLENNQVKINEAILQDPNFSIDQIFSITINYEYKGLGIQVDANTVSVYTTLQSIRETLPPIINIFALQHAPITNANNNVPITGGITFTDPNSNTGSPHPAFITEIPFSLSALPSTPGVYSVDYSTGTVYVYGADLNNDGTGPSPPLATYYYKFIYVSETDYVYDPDLLDLVALPLGNLVNAAATITFNYEQVLVSGVDYIADTHIEVLNERINNNINALNTLTVQNSPITNVFQIYNETSGEIYLLDRWNDNKVYFKFTNPPRLLQKVGENSIFTTVSNELLGIDSTISNSNNMRIFVILLVNNDIINSTQDGIGSSFNSSLIFSDGNIFKTELWFNKNIDISINLNKLSVVGEYVVDYTNGIIYVAVSSTQNNDLGTVTYKKNAISPEFPHIISVDDIYYRISFLNPKNKHFSYVSFQNGSIVPSNLDVSDEMFLNGVESAPYQLFNNKIGAFVDAIFVPNVTNAVKFIRSVYDYEDLTNSTNPLNFATVSTSSDFTITVNSIIKQSFESVQFDGSNYFITLNENIPYLSSGIIYNFSLIRVSDNQPLWNSSGTIVPGNPLKLILPNINSPQVGDLVNVNYSFTIKSLERVVVDYNKGDFFVDYTYLADEILVSYEYGDNVLDFRKNTNLPVGNQYYVSYKVGALRDALLKNFGTLVNVPDLANFDLTLNRERYREALQAALSSFIQGPTIAAIKNLVQIITHIEPGIIESAFEAWSLGKGLLFPIDIETTGSFQLLPARYGNGVLVDQIGQSISMPLNSNLRLEEGTFETWILPQWYGIDNDADLTFSITRDGVSIDAYRVFIGGSEYHPAINNGIFTINKNSKATGTPNTNKDGIFIYYASDISGKFNRWYLQVVDGYVSPATHTYKFQISSTGKFYDVKSISLIKPSNMTTFTGTNKVNLTIVPDGYGINEGLTFISDLEHYILDFGLEATKNRLSIYKDASGYINFRVYSKDSKMYIISADVSNWQPNVPHMIASSWKLNTRNNRDEMHLFIDGLEVPNIIKYGQKLQPYLHEKYRTVDPEEIVGIADRDIIGSIDLITTSGSPIVTSSINFSQYKIFAGDTIFIDEVGFSSVGYTILNINGQTLTLNTNMPVSISNGRFSVNRKQYFITSEINIVPNIAISTMHPIVEGTDLVATMGSSTVFSATNFIQQGVLPGYIIRIDDSNFALTYSILQVNANSLVISDPAPASLIDGYFQIYSTTENEIPGVRALNSSYSISQDSNFNNILTISNDVFANDLILIRTLGLNFRNVKKQYYVWSVETENVIMTQLPPPISLDEADITRIIVPSTVIGPANSTLSSGIFVSNLLDASRPSNSQNGRTIQVTISGTNVDFSTPVQVTINGVSGGSTISETITFTDYGTLDFIHAFTAVNYVQVNVKPINSAKNALAIDVREKYPITHSEFSALVPVVRYSYHIGGGSNLYADGYSNWVTDGYYLFSGLDIGNYLVITSPSSVAGYYIITGLSPDRHSISIQATYASFPVPLAAFSNGTYQIFNVNEYRSGLQNGFFTLEVGPLPTQAYFLDQGFYELDYSTYASIKFDPLNTNFYVGTDLNKNNQANSIIDQALIYNVMLSDVRIGEVTTNNTLSVTKDFNSIKALKPTKNMLVLMDFDNFPFNNNAGFYINSTTDLQHFPSNWAVNDNFNQSVVILDQPIILSNDGILDTHKQGTIEFWMSPIFDTANDPNNRFYFDAYGAIVEEVTSANNVSLKLSTSASKILKVVLAAGDPRIDYFAGGQLEIDTQHALQEDTVSIGTSTVIVSEPILQVITVKIANDFTEFDYFAGGSIGSDGKTIYLGTPLPLPNLLLIVTYQSSINDNTHLNTQVVRLNKKLPAQNSKVIVTYIPSSLQGDRISLFKDLYGYMNFSITASGITYVVRAPTRWAKDTWHRVKASYKMNSGLGNDEMRLFLDGYQYTDAVVADNLIPGHFPFVNDPINVGDGYTLIANINFKDPINNIFIGSDYSSSNPIFTLLDNFRISNISRPIYAPYGEPIDVNYSNNLNTVFPVTKDLYTTYLMDFDTLSVLNDNFATLINRETGAFDFTVNIYDSFDIVNSSAKVKEILENLINILKPANSRAFLKYQ